jgi:hypothetical protein
VGNPALASLGVLSNNAAAGGGDGGIPAVAEVNVRGGSVVRQRVLATPALISNRWSMAFKPDPETYLMAQSIEGEAIFRADVLALRGLAADQLRAQIWHPIPAGYVRGDVEVKGSPDGLGVNYSYVDRQQLMNFPAGALAGIIRMKVEQEVNYSGYDIGG